MIFNSKNIALPFFKTSALTLLCLLLSCLLFDCGKSKSTSEAENSVSPEISDTLKVVTLYGPTSFFYYRGDTLGIDFENARRFAEDQGLNLDIKILNNVGELINALKSGQAHVAAYPVPSISEYNSEILHCGPKEISWQVLVQKNGPHKVMDVTELIGKDVHVEQNSKYHFRLENLNSELGGGINIRPVRNDTIVEEDLLEMVSNGDIKYAVVDSQIANLYSSSYPDLDTSVRLSSDQAASWAVAKGLDSLAYKIDRWENLTHSSEFLKEIYKGYYDTAFSSSFESTLSYFKKLGLGPNKQVSEFDSYFKKYAPQSGFDWKLLASIAYCESGYKTNVASRFGAYGLMQVMPSSARSVGVDPANLGSPDANVLAAARILSNLNNSFKNRIEDPEERLKFVVASYNSGIAHILDAIALAEKTGLDPQKWLANVSIAALMKSRPEYYNDQVVKYGYFRGRETVNFVERVTGIYNYLQNTLSPPQNQKHKHADNNKH